jgi:hypothetical protein
VLIGNAGIYSSVRRGLWRKARIADRGNGDPEVFTVTHPFHPLKGRTFEVLAVRNNWGGDRVSYVDETGRLRTLPVEWTDIHTPDPATTAGEGRACFRADLLGQLRHLIDEQTRRREDASC